MFVLTTTKIQNLPPAHSPATTAGPKLLAGLMEQPSMGSITCG